MESKHLSSNAKALPKRPPVSGLWHGEQRTGWHRLCKKVSSCNAVDVASSRIRRELPGSSSVYASGWLTGEISGAQHYTLLCGVAVADASVAVMGGRDCRSSVTVVWSTASHTSLVWL